MYWHYLLSSLPPSCPPVLLKSFVMSHTRSWLSQKNLARRQPFIEVRISVSESVHPDTLLLVRPTLGNTVLSNFFPSCFFFTLSNCFHASLFHFYTTFSMSSLHCLLTSWIKTQFRNWSILRSSDANRTIHCRLVLALIFPGNPGPPHSHGQHQQEAQGVLTHHSCCTHSKSSASQCARYTGCSHTSSKGFNWLQGTAGKGCSIQTFFNLRGLCDIRDQT